MQADRQPWQLGPEPTSHSRAEAGSYKPYGESPAVSSFSRHVSERITIYHPPPHHQPSSGSQLPSPGPALRQLYLLLDEHHLLLLTGGSGSRSGGGPSLPHSVHVQGDVGAGGAGSLVGQQHRALVEALGGRRRQVGRHAALRELVPARLLLTQVLVGRHNGSQSVSRHSVSVSSILYT